MYITVNPSAKTAPSSRVFKATLLGVQVSGRSSGSRRRSQGASSSGEAPESPSRCARPLPFRCVVSFWRSSCVPHLSAVVQRCVEPMIELECTTCHAANAVDASGLTSAPGQCNCSRGMVTSVTYLDITAWSPVCRAARSRWQPAPRGNNSAGGGGRNGGGSGGNGQRPGPPTRSSSSGEGGSRLSVGEFLDAVPFCTPLLRPDLKQFRGSMAAARGAPVAAPGACRTAVDLVFCSVMQGKLRSNVGVADARQAAQRLMQRHASIVHAVCDVL